MKEPAFVFLVNFGIGSTCSTSCVSFGFVIFTKEKQKRVLYVLVEILSLDFVSWDKILQRNLNALLELW